MSSSSSSSSSSSPFSDLNALAPCVNANSASLLMALFGFVRRCYGLEARTPTPEELASVTGKFQMRDATTASSCCLASWRLIEEVIRGTYTQEGIAGLLIAGSVPADLSKAVAAACDSLQGQWKAEALKSTVSVPKLTGVDWRVDVKAASSHAASLGMPAVVMQLKVEDRVVAFEMDKETLQAMLTGLGKIRDQLNKVN